MYTTIFLALFLLCLALFLWTLKRYYILLTENIRLKAESSAVLQGQEILQNKFQSLATNALDDNAKRFLELAKTTLEKESLQANHKFQDLVKPIETVLNTYQKNIDELEKERQKSYFKVESELQKVAVSNQQLTQSTLALKDALKRPHVRGRWGEMQLKNCIELAGMSEFADITFQDAQTDDEGGRLIPDMTVKMPGGRVVLVDAKTPIDAFLAYLDSPSDEQKRIELTRHGKHIREHINKLSLKEYGQRFDNTADMTVMFLPNESFLYAALESQSDLVEYALTKKILVATPPTLIGLLKVIRFGWNEEKLAENARAISEVGSELHKRIATFVEGFSKMGDSIRRANDEYEMGLKRLNSQVLTQARKLETLGAKSTKELLSLEESL
ncbi:MAG: hypothetical protein A4S09_10660 [Proteobacteria bacterium SG_bin7]|nr:MAG: hypothetical protein A4S09_10660 [Proteobacteria bacterium SG_bin7]